MENGRKPLPTTLPFNAAASQLGPNVTARALPHMTTYIIDDPGTYAPLLHDRTPEGPAYYNAVMEHTAAVLAHPGLIADAPGARVAIVDVPRGGVPVGEAAAKALSAAGLNVTHASSQEKTDRDNLFPPAIDFSQTDVLVLADGIIGAGTTIIRHLAQIPADWKGEVRIVNNAAAQLGLDNIRAFAATQGREIRVVTGRVYAEEECAVVRFGDKEVYFVGKDDGIPDFGDKVSAAAPAVAPKAQPGAQPTPRLG